MRLPNLFGKKNAGEELEKKAPYRIKTELFPYKLYANKRSNSSLSITLRNEMSEPMLTSVVIELPSGLSFDEIGLEKAKEVRLGEIAQNEEKSASVNIHSDVGTDAGDYTITITAFAHYRDYGHVLNGVRKRMMIEVI
ncbi:MAG: hypothetical protein QW774_00100 [Candidatus Micrarchaeaceae archaeon]